MTKLSPWCSPHHWLTGSLWAAVGACDGVAQRARRDSECYPRIWALRVSQVVTAVLSTGVEMISLPCA